MKLISFFLLVTLLFPVGNNQSRFKKTVKVPIPENLVTYFANEEKKHPIPYHASIEETCMVRKSIELLQEYATGKTTHYPAQTVKEAINSMIGEIRYIESHRPLNSLQEMEEALAFIYPYLDQAFRLCPDISLLTNLYSPDKQIGILSFTGWGPYPMLCFLIHPDYKGGYKITLWETHETNFTKIHPIEKEGKRYYLLTSVGYLYYSEPAVSLVSLDEKEIKEHLLPLKKEVKDFFHCSEEKEDILFNPQKSTWKKYQQNSEGHWIHIHNTPTAHLIRNKENYTIEIN